MNDVKLLARWSGWCDPCATDRPLILTESGQRGLRAWMRGISHEDRFLRLTCGVCGEWQSVEPDEEDSWAAAPKASALTAVRPLGAVQIRVHLGAPGPAVATTLIPLPSKPRDGALELLAQGYDLVSLAS